MLAFGSRAALASSGWRTHLRDLYGEAQLIGCSTAGEILGEQVFDDTIACTALEFDAVEVRVETVDVASSEQSWEAGASLAKRLGSPALRQVVVLSDGLHVNGSGFVSGLLEHLPAGVGVTGGLSTDSDQQNQGHVELQSIVGRGTTARVRLPVVPAPSDLPTVVTPDGAVSGGSETILLVEDENIVRLLAVQLLSRLGYQVVVAERPRAALAIAPQLTQPIDLLVTDVVMPEMNGQDLYHEIVKVRPGLRVLYMSGYAPTGTLDTEVMEAGAVFLPKPFTMKQMADAIRDCLNTTVTLAR